MVNITMTRDEVTALLTEEAGSFGYTLDEVRELARSGRLDEPELRDLWLIWGDTPLSFDAHE